MAVNKHKKGDAPGWMKKGSDAKQAMKKEDAKEAKRKEEQGKMYRFYLPQEKQTEITFLDGDLDDDGVLDVFMYYEHQLHMNGHWRNWFVCTTEAGEPCPICEDKGEDSRALVGVFTVIDHTEWVDKQGKTHKDERKLFVAKRSTIKQLQMLATKRGGLTGCTFDVMRTGDKSPAVGNQFDFTSKVEMDVLAKTYKAAKEGPADYGKEITYRTAAELRELGFGSAPIGTEQPMAEGDGSNKYSDHL